MILGLQRIGDRLHINPCIPNDWPEYQINYRFGNSLYHILVKNQQSKKSGKNHIIMDGKGLTEDFVPLSEDGKTHEILITISARGSEGR